MPECDETNIFGAPVPAVQYTERRAAYVVIVTNDGQVATVQGAQAGSNRPVAFLPGGGSLPGETPEETVDREVNEELGCSVRLIRKLGEATEYFYADSDNRHYKMYAVFFAGEFTDSAGTAAGEHELVWLPVAKAEEACFHPCHAWAVRQAKA